MRRLLRPAFALTCVLGLVGCDRASKIAAESVLRHRAPFALLPGIVELAYTENRDIAFNGLARLSLYPSARALAVLALAATFALLILWIRRQPSRWKEHLAFAMIVAGGLGNALDRLTRGHVIDFMHVQFWPVFNVADILVVGGVAWLVVCLRKGGERASVTR